jgi:hypothetical protein
MRGDTAVWEESDENEWVILSSTAGCVDGRTVTKDADELENETS